MRMLIKAEMVPSRKMCDEQICAKDEIAARHIELRLQTPNKICLTGYT